jgi:hypothetical protein
VDDLSRLNMEDPMPIEQAVAATAVVMQQSAQLISPKIAAGEPLAPEEQAFVQKYPQLFDDAAAKAQAVSAASIAKKIVDGNTQWTPEELQYQQNNPQQVEQALKALQLEKMPAAPLTEPQAAQLIANMEQNAEEAPTLELTPENWEAEFGENGVVETPLGEVKMGENQYLKLLKSKREKQLGMIKPTLTNPDVVIEDPSEAKEGGKTERPSSYVYAKSFNVGGEKIHHFESVTVSKDGKEVVISNHMVNPEGLKNIMQRGAVIYQNKKFTPISSEVPLAESQRSGLPDLVPAQEVNSSGGKGTENSATNQTSPRTFEVEKGITATETAQGAYALNKTYAKSELDKAEKLVQKLNADYEENGLTFALVKLPKQDEANPFEKPTWGIVATQSAGSPAPQPAAPEAAAQEAPASSPSSQPADPQPAEEIKPVGKKKKKKSGTASANTLSNEAEPEGKQIDTATPQKLESSVDGNVREIENEIKNKIADYIGWIINQAGEFGNDGEFRHVSRVEGIGYDAGIVPVDYVVAEQFLDKVLKMKAKGYKYLYKYVKNRGDGELAKLVHEYLTLKTGSGLWVEKPAAPAAQASQPAQPALASPQAQPADRRRRPPRPSPSRRQPSSLPTWSKTPFPCKD